MFTTNLSVFPEHTLNNRNKYKQAHNTLSDIWGSHNSSCKACYVFTTSTKRATYIRLCD